MSKPRKPLIKYTSNVISVKMLKFYRVNCVLPCREHIIHIFQFFPNLQLFWLIITKTFSLGTPLFLSSLSLSLFSTFSLSCNPFSRYTSPKSSSYLNLSPSQSFDFHSTAFSPNHIWEIIVRVCLDVWSEYYYIWNVGIDGNFNWFVIVSVE